ncbi:hypothetical protein MCEMSHM24_02423 [Comamonadaceae bacterium]
MAFEDLRKTGSTDPEPGPTIDAFKRMVELFRSQEEAEVVKTKDASVASHGTVTFLLVIITCLYIWFEARWNVMLVATIFQGDASKKEIESLVMNGRWLAAFGLTWFLCKGLFGRESKSIRGLILSFAFVAGATVCTYALISHGYEKVISAVPDRSATTFAMAASERQIAIQKDELEPMAAVFWALKLADPAQKGIDQKLGEAVAEGRQLAIAAWPELQSKISSVPNREILLSQFDAAYEQFLAASQRSKAWTNGNQQANESEFQRLTGMRPNAKATRGQFAAELMRSPIDNYRALGHAYLSISSKYDPVVYSTHSGVDLLASELESIQSDSDLADLVEKKIRIAASGMNKDIKREAVAAVLLPPIAVALSALAVILNIGNLVGLLVAQIWPRLAIPSAIWPLGTVAAIFAAISPEMSLKGLETSFAWLLNHHSISFWILGKLVSIENLLIAMSL